MNNFEPYVRTSELSRHPKVFPLLCVFAFERLRHPRKSPLQLLLADLGDEIKSPEFTEIAPCLGRLANIFAEDIFVRDLMSFLLSELGPAHFLPDDVLAVQELRERATRTGDDRLALALSKEAFRQTAAIRKREAKR